jgi:hypothetical protein
MNEEVPMRELVVVSGKGGTGKTPVTLVRSPLKPGLLNAFGSAMTATLPIAVITVLHASHFSY